MGGHVVTDVFRVPDSQTRQHQRKQRAHKGNEDDVRLVEVKNSDHEHHERENKAR